MKTPFKGRTGRGVRVAVIDSGVNSLHPHIGKVAGGFPDGDYLDVLGHGTAVMAAIQEKAPEAEYFAVRVFGTALRTNVETLLRAIEWSIEHRMDVVNLSLGTANPAHAERFAELVARAGEAGVILVSARESFPGSLPGVIGVGVDWDCPLEEYFGTSGELWASGYPRSMPGVPKARNLKGISFAVANMTGFVVRAAQGLARPSYEGLMEVLVAEVE